MPSLCLSDLNILKHPAHAGDTYHFHRDHPPLQNQQVNPPDLDEKAAEETARPGSGS